MNTRRILTRSTTLWRALAALAAPTAILLGSASLPAQGLTLANPHWNISLSDYGYSDFLLDNTPGFEGREYLSGEWGAAIGYQRAGGVVVPPRFLDPEFWFPDWLTLSTFHVVSPLTQTGLNADNLPIAQSIIANGDLQITLRHEMLDTIVGVPMGVTPASATGSSNAIASSRYVLKQTATIRNISGAPLAAVQFFQFVHGLHSQRGVYDDRPYAGTLGQFRHDVTLAGVDPYSAGANSSSVGLEDFLGFQASVAPSGFEIGYFGIEGNGLDDHWQGKPSEGVHLSIEDNWQHAPYNARLGTDHFAPPTRWVSGAARWDLGSLAPNQSVSLELLLSLRTGTRVPRGSNSGGSCNGGSSVPGGGDCEFDDVSDDGACFGDYSQADDDEVATRIASGEFGAFTFLRPGGRQQLWRLQFTGQFDGLVHLTLGYDPTILPPTLDPAALTLYQSEGTSWQALDTTVDVTRHTLSVSTTSLSTFALGVGSGASFAISASAAPTSGGAIAGAGTYADGARATLVATAAAGYVFVNWTEDGAVVSTSPGYTFTVAADRTLEANFASVGPNLAISTSGTPTEGGTTSGDGAYPQGATATVSAQANPGYKFSKWLVNGVQVSTARNYSFAVTANRALVAKFKPVYTMTVSADPPNGGEVEADDFYEPGEIAKLKAKPEPGWCFVNWTQNGTVVSTDPNYTFTVTGNRALVGHFAFGRMIAASPYPVNGGTVSGGGVYQNGQSVTLTATAFPGYIFLDWTESGLTVSADESYTFTTTTNRTLVANFIAAGTDTIAVSASPAEGGVVSGGGVYVHGTMATVEAVANAGYAFVNWTEDDVEVSTDESYSFTVTTDRTLVAKFMPVEPGPTLTIIPSGDGVVISWPTAFSGWTLQERADAAAGDWTDSILPVEVVGDQYQVLVAPLAGNRFFRLAHP